MFVTAAARLRGKGLALFAAVGLALGACGETEEEMAAVAAPEAAPAPETTAPQEQAADDDVGSVYTYNAIGKRDPFRTYFAELEREESDKRKLTELQKYDLDQLRLVAVVVGTASPKAMVEAPDGKGHVVKLGSLIGKHWGQVKHIRRGEIIIQEEFRDFTGRRVTHLVPMKLPEDKQVGLR